MIYDPQQLHLWQPDPQAVEKLRCDLLAIIKPCGFINILVPSVEKIMHDRTYSTQSGSVCISKESVPVCDSKRISRGICNYQRKKRKQGLKAPTHHGFMLARIE